MPDTFPALQQDALDVIQKANHLVLLAHRLRANAERGDAAAVRADCKAIAESGEALGELCDAFQATTDHFVAYEEEPEGNIEVCACGFNAELCAHKQEVGGCFQDSEAPEETALGEYRYPDTEGD